MARRRTHRPEHGLTAEEDYAVVATLRQLPHRGPGRSPEPTASTEDAARRRRVRGRAPDDRGRPAESRLEPPTQRPYPRYLLFSGRHPAAGGLGELVGVFDDEDAARAAFTALRLRPEPVAAWGELGAIDSPGRCAVLCWFGHERPVPRLGQPGETTGSAVVGAGPRRRFWRRWERVHQRSGERAAQRRFALMSAAENGWSLPRRPSHLADRRAGQRSDTRNGSARPRRDSRNR